MKKASSFKFQEILDLLIEFSYLAVVFFVPLYFSILFPTYNIFELSKLSLFKIFVWLLLFLTLTKLIFFKQSVTWLKKYISLPLIFIVGLSLTLLTSINFNYSWFGSYDRQLGYLSYLFYFLWFVLVVFNVKTIDNRRLKNDPKDKVKNKLNRIIVVATISGLLVSLYGILQILGIDFLTWPEDPLFTRRTLSTFGQPNFLASWLLLVIPLSAYLIYKNKKVLTRFFYILTLGAELLCLFFTSSRGGLFALALTALLFIIYIIIFAKGRRAYKFLLSFCLGVIVIFSLLGLNYLFPNRLNNLFNFQSGSSAARLNFYGAATDAIIKKPLFGYGLENGSEVFISYYQPDWGIHGDVGATTDKAHNLILDIILATGFYGLALFTIFYYYFFRLSLENIRQKKINALSLALALGGAAYLFSLFFSFTIVSGELYFWLYLALLVVINSGTKETTTSRARLENIDQAKKLSFSGSRLAKTALTLGLFLIVGAGIYYEFKVLLADYYFNRLYYVLGEKQYFTSLLLADYAAQEKANPVNQEYYQRFLGDKLSDFFPEIDELVLKKSVSERLSQINATLPITGYENIYVKAKINSVLGNYQEAEKYFQVILRLTPYWPRTYIDLGKTLKSEGKLEAAISSYRLAEASLPDLNDSRFNDLHKNILKLYRKIIFQDLGDIYFFQKNYSNAEKYYQAAYLSDVNDITLFKKIADTYYYRGDLDKAIEYNLRGASRAPQDANWFLAVVALEIAKGDKVATIQYLQTAHQNFPEEKVFNDLLIKYSE